MQLTEGPQSFKHGDQALRQTAPRGGDPGRDEKQMYAAADRVDTVMIPPASWNTVQNLKNILTTNSEAEIYATLIDCGLDPNTIIDSQGMLEASLAFCSCWFTMFN